MAKINRPKIKVDLDPIDSFIEVIGAMAACLLLALPLYHYQQLPDTIPTHFNLAGEADGFGAKMTIWMLPVVGIINYIFIWFISKYAHIFNYPKKITADNAPKHYKLATKMLRWINVILVCFFCYLTYSVIQSSLQRQEGLSMWFLPIFMGLLFGVMIFYLYKMAKVK